MDDAKKGRKQLRERGGSVGREWGKGEPEKDRKRQTGDRQTDRDTGKERDRERTQTRKLYFTRTVA